MGETTKRLIEKGKTYRIQHGAKYNLVRVTDIGNKAVTLHDLKTDKSHSMSRSAFQEGVDSGKICVSAGKKQLNEE